MAHSSLHLLSLCSGTGMLDEGVCCAVPGTRIVGYVEREAFAAALLLARMGEASLEPAPVWCASLEELRPDEWRGIVDCITAGFPCQPWSTAGKLRGTEDERWIWPAIAGIIRAIEPPVVFLENVPGLASGRGLNHVLGDVAEMGFDAEWGHLAAADVGASHERDCIFILAIDASRGRGVLRQSSERGGRFTHRSSAELGDAARRERWEQNGQRQPSERWTGSRGTGTALADAGDGQLPHPWRRPQERTRSRPASPTVADSNRRQCQQQWWSLEEPRARLWGFDRRNKQLANDSCLFGGTEQRSESQRVLSPVAHAASSRLAARQDARADSGNAPDERSRSLEPERDNGILADRHGSRLERKHSAKLLSVSPGSGDGTNIFAPGPRDDRWSEIIALQPWLAPAIESGVRGLVDGHAVVLDESRVDQLRAIGNGVVALQAAVAFRVLAKRLLGLGI